MAPLLLPAYELQRAIRTHRWKYIRRYGSRRTPVLPNCDDSSSKDVLLANGWAEQNLPTEQLYDLAFDPYEANNLAESPDHAIILADLRVQLNEWMRSTDDPLLAGYVPAPAGVVVNDPAGIGVSCGTERRLSVIPSAARNLSLTRRYSSVAGTLSE
jgi:hypothetical protein